MFYLFSQTFTEKKMDLSLLPSHKITTIIIGKEKDKLQKERKNNQNYKNMDGVFSLRTAWRHVVRIAMLTAYTGDYYKGY